MRGSSLLLLAALLIPDAQQSGPDGAVPLDGRWTLTGERTTIVREGPLDVLQIETGSAARPDIRLLDGTIDFDVRLTRRRSFVYVYFRTQGDGEREEFYLRPHKSTLPDAVQYAPVWQGRSAWQLHHGPGGTAPVPFETERWTHVRVVIQGRAAALFVDDMTRPALVVPRLSRDPQAGGVGLGGFLPADVPGAGPIATFANVNVRPGIVEFDLSALAASHVTLTSLAETPGIIREWALSRAFAASDGDAAVLPGTVTTGAFERLPAEAGGLVQLHRHLRVPDGVRTSAAVARVTLSAESARTVPVDLGFSDAATVFLNGAPLFSADASYAFDRPRREGLIGFDQARVYLRLQRGDNQLAVLVRDSFGGWGVMGRLVDTRGITVSAR
jgi:hypothetical protein